LSDELKNEEKEFVIWDHYCASEAFEGIANALETATELSLKLEEWVEMDWENEDDRPKINVENLVAMRSQFAFIGSYAQVMAHGMMLEYRKRQKEGADRFIEEFKKHGIEVQRLGDTTIAVGKRTTTTETVDDSDVEPF
jgi:hypothetical protein